MWLFRGGASQAAMARSIFDFTVKGGDGTSLDLSTYRGTKKAFLVLNYRELNALDGELGSKGLAILGFPSNEFGGQEPYDDATIQENAKNPEKKTYATFPVFAKIKVNGPEADPLYTYLNSGATGVLGTTSVKWNFSKYLCDAEGHVVKRFGPTAAPSSIKPDIEKLLV
ncbi:hypothetical protein CTAYLR_003888 [Chrysophaeum taylorii]|uniref:Glutathione peroxidase n=1 Tax=Chrysophaeum taylorii TaxID=2483200 RepID=A0AAD7UM91_9STRA|nr:hypothetical protein CTAYLR_003888 [Chrysophaeum taylorii]